MFNCDCLEQEIPRPAKPFKQAGRVAAWQTERLTDWESERMTDLGDLGDEEFGDWETSEMRNSEIGGPRI